MDRDDSIICEADKYHRGTVAPPREQRKMLTPPVHV